MNSGRSGRRARRTWTKASARRRACAPSSAAPRLARRTQPLTHSRAGAPRRANATGGARRTASAVKTGRRRGAAAAVTRTMTTMMTATATTTAETTATAMWNGPSPQRSRGRQSPRSARSRSCATWSACGSVAAALDRCASTRASTRRSQAHLCGYPSARTRTRASPCTAWRWSRASPRASRTPSLDPKAR